MLQLTVDRLVLDREQVQVSNEEHHFLLSHRERRFRARRSSKLEVMALAGLVCYLRAIRVAVRQNLRSDIDELRAMRCHHRRREKRPVRAASNLLHKMQ